MSVVACHTSITAQKEQGCLRYGQETLSVNTEPDLNDSQHRDFACPPLILSRQEATL
jgi:hypothetical protein